MCISAMYTFYSCLQNLVCNSLVHCSFCFTLIRFLFLTDFALHNFVYALRNSTFNAGVLVIFFDVALHAFETRHVDIINNEQRLISQCERGFLSVNKAYCVSYMVFDILFTKLLDLLLTIQKYIIIWKFQRTFVYI